jgi:hypothetical protein
MKRVLILLLAVLPITVFSQKKQKKVKTYGQVAMQLSKDGKFGLGGLLGYKPTKNIGVGAGFEIGSYTNLSPTYFYPAYLDVRYFVKNNNSLITPFLGVQYGTIIGNANTNSSNSTSYAVPFSSAINRTTTTISNNILGKSFWGFEVGIFASKKHKYFGPMISFAYRDCNFLTKSTSTIKNTQGFTQLSLNTIEQEIKSGGNVYVVKLGIKF